MKRLVDNLCSVIGLVVLWPVGLLVATGVKMTSRGPIFFRQARLGRQGTTFQIYKFRTMTVQEPGSGCQVTAGGDPRITPFGAFLRRYKLDELPQILNVITGDMSFVGPRPEVPEFAELYPLEYARLLKVRPGITHPATLNFRREEEILAQVVDPREFYIDTVLPEKLAAYESCLEQSLAQDIRTIIETIVPHLSDDAYGPEHFVPAPAPAARQPEPTIVANIPAFASDLPQPVARNSAVMKSEELEEALAVGS